MQSLNETKARDVLEIIEEGNGIAAQLESGFIVIIFPHRGEKYLSTNFFIYIVEYDTFMPLILSNYRVRLLRVQHVLCKIDK